MIRDDELNRMVKYAEGLGIKVRFLKERPSTEASAEWDLSGKEIIIYYNNRLSKTQLILNLLHELGHHMDFIYNKRRHTKQIQEAYEADVLTKRHREVIYNDEVNGAAYHEIIYHELGLKIPLWKVQVERDYELEIYYRAIDGEPITREEKRAIRRKLLDKYKTV